jgi:hypothetical protein
MFRIDVADRIIATWDSYPGFIDDDSYTMHMNSLIENLEKNITVNSARNWATCKIRGVPRQTANDCGPFTLKFSEILLSGKGAVDKINSGDIIEYRKMIAREYLEESEIGRRLLEEFHGDTDAVSNYCRRHVPANQLND